MSNPLVTIIHGDCLEKLRTLPAGSVQACITSPPFWALRDYKIPPTVWSSIDYSPVPNAPKISVPAWVGCLGQEQTPEMFVAHLVLVFREVRRVLREDGTLWVNLGDSYSRRGGTDKTVSPSAKVRGTRNTILQKGDRNQQVAEGLKEKDMAGIPWRSALALQADGWILRRDNIWFKGNPMPESISGWRWEQHRIKTRAGTYEENGKNKDSIDHRKIGFNDRVRDPDTHSARYVDCPGCKKCQKNNGLILRKGSWRPTTAHEYFFQFSKSDQYFCDGEAVKEQVTGGAHKRGDGISAKTRPTREDGVRANQSFHGNCNELVQSRNMRSVWKVNSHVFKGAHFATFPPALIRPIVLAATPVASCVKCGAPFAPVVERGAPNILQQRACGGDADGKYHGNGRKDYNGNGVQNPSDVKARILAGMVEKKITGHLPTCSCGVAGELAVILDPFGGSGTTGQVAAHYGRKAILIELADHYLPLIEERCADPLRAPKEKRHRRHPSQMALL